MSNPAHKKVKVCENNLESRINALNLPEEFKNPVSSLIHKIVEEAEAKFALDDSTGFIRRKPFEINLEKFLATKCLQGYCAVVFADLSGFKAVNDNYGHQVGDKVIAIVAQILADNVRSKNDQSSRLKDLHSRYAGDEFVSLIVNLREVHSIYEICHRIMTSVKDYDWDSILGTDGLKVNIDLGAVYFRINNGLRFRRQRASFLVQELIRLADKEMYLSKRLNKKEFTLSEPSIRLVRFSGDGVEIIPRNV